MFDEKRNPPGSSALPGGFDLDRVCLVIAENPVVTLFWFKTEPECDRLIGLDMNRCVGREAAPGATGRERYITRIDNDVDRLPRLKVELTGAFLRAIHLVKGEAHFMLEAIVDD